MLLHINKKNFIKLGRDNKLSLLTPVSVKTEYLVNIEYGGDDQSNHHKRLDFSTSIEFVKRIEGHYIVRVEKYDFFINRREPSIIAEQVAETINKAVYPVDVIIDFDGNIKEISNIDIIKKRWKKIRKELEKEYSGNVIQVILKKTDQMLNDALRLEIALSKDMFWAVFFSPNYLGYGTELRTNKKVAFPIIPYGHPVEFDGTSSIKSFLSDYKTVEIFYQGNAEIGGGTKFFGRTAQKGPLNAKLDIRYDLDEEHHIPVWITSACAVYDKDTGQDLKTVDMSIIAQ